MCEGLKGLGRGGLEGSLGTLGSRTESSLTLRVDGVDPRGHCDGEEDTLVDGDDDTPRDTETRLSW